MFPYSVFLVRQWILISRQSLLSLEEYPTIFVCEDGPRILKSIPRKLCGNAKYHYPSCQRADWMFFFRSWRILVSRVRCGGTRRGAGNELSSGSFVSGASSQFGFDLVELASLSTESLKSGEALSFEFGHVVHYVCDRGHAVIGNAASTLSFTVPCLMSARGVISVGFRKHFLFQPLWRQVVRVRRRTAGVHLRACIFDTVRRPSELCVSRGD